MTQTSQGQTPAEMRAARLEPVWLTQEAFDRLQAEFTQLSGPGRVEIARIIEEARAEGDLRENGGYVAAREEQSKREGRIRQLDAMLQRAKVGVPPAEAGVVAPGSKVTARFVGDDEVVTFVLGSREVMGLDDSVDMDVYSPQSPLGSAVNGHSAGDRVSFKTPTGRSMEVDVLDAAPFSG